MAYFLSSLLQKHVLKYALSRLGLVDTEALDLDNLGIRWGQRSTVELRDIGLKLEVSLRDQPSFSGVVIAPNTGRSSDSHISIPSNRN